MWNPCLLIRPPTSSSSAASCSNHSMLAWGGSHTAAQITKRLISEGRVRGSRDRRTGRQRKRDEMGWDDREEMGSGNYLYYELQIVCRQRQKRLSRMCESFFFRALKIQMLYLTLPSLLLLVKPRPNHNPPCVISQQCFWPPGLMAQCSLYDMYCLKGRSALLFSSNLIPKLFKHQGFFFHIQNKECGCVFVSVFGRVCV